MLDVDSVKTEQLISDFVYLTFLARVTQGLAGFQDNWYDMIRYDTVYLRALKSWRDGQLNLAHGAETKKKQKLKTKTR